MRKENHFKYFYFINLREGRSSVKYHIKNKYEIIGSAISSLEFHLQSQLRLTITKYSMYKPDIKRLFSGAGRNF